MRVFTVVKVGNCCDSREFFLRLEIKSLYIHSIIHFWVFAILRKSGNNKRSISNVKFFISLSPYHFDLLHQLRHWRCCRLYTPNYIIFKTLFAFSQIDNYWTNNAHFEWDCIIFKFGMSQYVKKSAFYQLWHMSRRFENHRKL